MKAAQTCYVHVPLMNYEGRKAAIPQAIWDQLALKMQVELTHYTILLQVTAVQPERQEPCVCLRGGLVQTQPGQTAMGCREWPPYDGFPESGSGAKAGEDGTVCHTAGRKWTVPPRVLWKDGQQNEVRRLANGPSSLWKHWSMVRTWIQKFILIVILISPHFNKNIVMSSRLD